MFGGGGDSEMASDVAAIVKTKLSALDNMEARLAKFTADIEESQKSKMSADVTH